jgi:hypothetical protein
MVYFPLAALFTIIMLAGAYGYITVEETAVTTLPPVTQTAASPVATPQP